MADGWVKYIYVEIYMCGGWEVGNAWMGTVNWKMVWDEEEGGLKYKGTSRYE